VETPFLMWKTNRTHGNCVPIVKISKNSCKGALKRKRDFFPLFFSAADATSVEVNIALALCLG